MWTRHSAETWTSPKKMIARVIFQMNSLRRWRSSRVTVFKWSVWNKITKFPIEYHLFISLLQSLCVFVPTHLRVERAVPQKVRVRPPESSRADAQRARRRLWRNVYSKPSDFYEDRSQLFAEITLSTFCRLSGKAQDLRMANRRGSQWRYMKWEWGFSVSLSSGTECRRWTFETGRRTEGQTLLEIKRDPSNSKGNYFIRIMKGIFWLRHEAVSFLKFTPQPHLSLRSVVHYLLFLQVHHWECWFNTEATHKIRISPEREADGACSQLCGSFRWRRFILIV